MPFSQNYSCGVHSSATSIDMAGAMISDAQDTYVKILPWASLFALISASANEEIGKTVFLEYLSDIVGFDTTENTTVTDRTWVSDDGDVICFRIHANHPNGPYESGIDYSVKGRFVPFVGISGDRLSIFSKTIETTSASYSWTVPEIAVSMAKQLQASELIRRLATLISVETITPSDFEALVSDLKDQVSPDVSVILDDLKSSGALISGSSVFAGLQKIYANFSHVSVNEQQPDTIDFDDTDYSLKSFFGTVIDKFVPAAVDVVSTILLLTGNVLGSVAAVTLQLGKWIVDFTSDVADVNTNEIYDYFAVHHEISSPIFQCEVSVEHAPTILKDTVSNYGIAKIVLPWCNVYAWIVGENLRLAGYVNLDINLPSVYPSEGSNSGYFGYTRTDPEALQASIKAFSEYNECRATGFGPSGAVTPVSVANKGLEISDRNGIINGDSTISKSIALAGLLYHRLNVMHGGSNSATIYWNENVHPSIEDALTSFEERVQSDPSTLPFYLALCAKYGAVAWTLFLNYLIPAFRSMVEEDPVLFINDVLFGNDSLMNASESQASVVPVINFRSSFQVVPPQYDGNSLLPALLVPIISVAAVAGAVVATKSVIKRRATRTLTARYASVQDKLQATQEAARTYGSTSLEFKTAYAEYSKMANKYNWLARFCGSSTISKVDGWLNAGSSSSFSSTVPEAGGNPLMDYTTGYIAAEMGISNPEGVYSVPELAGSLLVR